MLTAVRDGDMLFAVDQQPYLQGFLPVILLAQQARYQVFPGRGELIPTGPQFVTKRERGRRDPAQRRGDPLIAPIVARVRRCRSAGVELDLEAAAAAADVDRWWSSALSSITVGSGFCCPSGLMPPAT